MHRTSFHVLRVGTAITFLWIGVLIFREPMGWGAYLQPWAAGLLPVPLDQAMLGTAILDIVIGAMLLIDTRVWLAALAGSLHLVIVLAVVGITEVTIRDLAILAATLALMAEAMPKEWVSKFQK